MNKDTRTPSQILEDVRNGLDRPSSTSSSVLPLSIPSVSSSSLPGIGLSYQTTLNKIFSDITPYLNLSSISPNYYGFVTGGATPAALAGDLIASVYDQNVGVHLPNETVATNIEVNALNMLLDLFHLPRNIWGIGGSHGGSGTLTTGATSSNILGLALAREWILQTPVSEHGGRVTPGCSTSGLKQSMFNCEVDHIEILTTLPHSSIGKAASILGLGRANVTSICDDSSPLDISLPALEAAVLRHPPSASPGKRVAFILVVSAGEVNTGRFATTSAGQWQQIRSFCDAHHIWIHVDGAFGLFGRLLLDEHYPSSSSSSLSTNHAAIIAGVQGIELADSITSDAHKLLNVPYDCGIFFTRHRGLAQHVFGNGNAAYLNTATAAQDGPGDGIISPLNLGLENSRRFRALPVYATLMAYGRRGYVEMLVRQIGLARRVAAWVFDHEAYELLPEGGESKEEKVGKTFMVVLFRANDAQLNESLVTKVNAKRKLYVTGTSWDEKPAARIAVSNWQADVERDGLLIEKVLLEVVAEWKK